MKNLMLVCGTRPEAIKLAPLVKRLKENPLFNTVLCSSGQHREMMAQVLSLFEITPDIDLNIMTENQGLIDITTEVLQGLRTVFAKYKPDIVIVHGDTNTTFATSLAAYYHQIPVHHVEAGLRTGDLYSPWPEEGNRKLTSAIVAHHYAPTSSSKQHLIDEGVDTKNITVTGNTVIDSLYDASARIDNDSSLQLSIQNALPSLDPNKKLILVTCHRRENFGESFEQICRALYTIGSRDDVQVVYPVHLNPKVQDPVKRYLSSHKNIQLLPTLGYLEFIYLMKKAYIVLTDSGGIQEEAPALGKPVLVMRETTERPEALAAGTAMLVGKQEHDIVKGVYSLLDTPALWESMSTSVNPYGDGFACDRIIQHLSAQST